MLDSYQKFEIFQAPVDNPPLVRDLVRFLAVDIILIIMLRLLLGIGLFANLNQYVLAVLGSKLALSGYLVWLSARRDDAWNRVGGGFRGTWKGWVGTLAAFVVFMPLTGLIGSANHWLLSRLYGLLNIPYFPEIQDIMLILFDSGTAGTTRLLLVVFVVIVGPIMEELAFRGMGLDAFRTVGGAASAVIMTGLLFGLYHFSIHTFVPLSILGMVFGCIRVWTRTLWCPIAFHCLYNFTVLLAAARAAGLLDFSQPQP